MAASNREIYSFSDRTIFKIALLNLPIEIIALILNHISSDDFLNFRIASRETNDFFRSTCEAFKPLLFQKFLHVTTAINYRNISSDEEITNTGVVQMRPGLRAGTLLRENNHCYFYLQTRDKNQLTLEKKNLGVIKPKQIIFFSLDSKYIHCIDDKWKIWNAQNGTPLYRADFPCKQLTSRQMIPCKDNHILSYEYKNDIHFLHLYYFDGRKLELVRSEIVDKAIQLLVSSNYINGFTTISSDSIRLYDDHLQLVTNAPCADSEPRCAQYINSHTLLVLFDNRGLVKWKFEPNKIHEKSIYRLGNYEFMHTFSVSKSGKIIALINSGISSYHTYQTRYDGTYRYKITICDTSGKIHNTLFTNTKYNKIEFAQNDTQLILHSDSGYRKISFPDDKREPNDSRRYEVIPFTRR